jgi:hypothetical protein
MQTDCILQDIMSKYGSLRDPDFGFQNQAMASRPFAPLVDELLVHFFVKDTTDPNQDASFGYTISNGEQRWILQLSMVGRYGVLFRAGNADPTLVEPNEVNPSPEESLILHLAKKYRVLVLGQSILTKPVPLHLFFTEPWNVRLYHALFSEDAVRWQSVIANSEVTAKMAAA